VAFRACRGAYALARDNKSHEDTRCLYVGSSANLLRRIREHAGQGHEKTYALHMGRWLPDEAEVRLTYAFLGAGSPSLIASALEDHLWETRRPMFGRRGAR
jgi:hypothetical protein